MGGAYFWFNLERHWPWGDQVPAPDIAGNPLVSVVIPCFNEGSNVHETIEAALRQRYTHIEVIAVNDGSSDDTGQILDQLVATDKRLRVVHLARNQGKAIALQAGAAAARSEYLVCIDGDALLDRDAVAYLVAPLVPSPIWCRRWWCCWAGVCSGARAVCSMWITSPWGCGSSALS